MSRKKKRKNKNRKKGKQMHNFGQYPQGYEHFTLPSSDEWTVEIDTISACSKAPEMILIWFNILAKKKMDTLMGKYKSLEWLAYLIGEKINDKEYVIEDLFIPKQEVSSARVDNIECENFNDLKQIGVIHSHHGMGNGFSGTDHEFINQNHNVSLCVSKTGINGQVRWKTPCGALKIVENVKTKLKIDFDFDKEAFLKKADEVISTKTYTHTPIRQIPRYVQNNVCGQPKTPATSYANGVAVTRETFDMAKNVQNAGKNSEKEREIESWQDKNQDKINKLWDQEVLNDDPDIVLIEEEKSLREALEHDLK